MKNVITLILYIFPMYLFAQDSIKAQDNCLKIGINISPNYCFRTLKAKSSQYNQFVATRNDKEIPKWGFTTGIYFSYPVNKKFFYDFGLFYGNVLDNFF